MAKRIWESIMFSLEWRMYAFVITSVFLWVTTGHLVTAAAQAFGLQVVLFIGQTLWYYFRTTGAHSLTLDALTTRLARGMYRSIIHGRRK